MSGFRKTTTLQGLKAGRLGPGAWIYSFASPMLARRGVVTYSVHFETTPKFDATARDVERRREARRPVHLQSGKILDHKDRFLTEFIFKNRTETGIRLKLARRVTLPKSILLYDDQQGALVAANIVWQRGSDAGCRISRMPALANEKLLTRLRGPYYAVR